MNKINRPKISVITCTLNSEKFLKKALESVENQTYKNIEHIINDSYSNDATLGIIQDYIDRNGTRYPIKLIHCEPEGVGNALNVATEHAAGEIIHYLHSDDYYVDAHSLEKVAGYFNENPDLV
ncbi:MAG: glycosyltransferase, partial [Chloroflexota bacterium]|nr:glycosyltransferase [Chloroflexota bacterium]